MWPPWEGGRPRLGLPVPPELLLKSLCPGGQGRRKAEPLENRAPLRAATRGAWRHPVDRPYDSERNLPDKTETVDGRPRDHDTQAKWQHKPAGWRYRRAQCRHGRADWQRSRARWHHGLVLEQHSRTQWREGRTSDSQGGAQCCVGRAKCCVGRASCRHGRSRCCVGRALWRQGRAQCCVGRASWRHGRTQCCVGRAEWRHGRPRLPPTETPAYPPRWRTVRWGWCRSASFRSACR